MCAQRYECVLKGMNVCLRAWICVQGCDMCSKE
jgi:hypothetical protein